MKRDKNVLVALVTIGVGLVLVVLAIWLYLRRPMPMPFVSPVTYTIYLPLVASGYPQPVKHGTAGQPSSCGQAQELSIDWYYNWSPGTGLDCPNVEFVPMIWQPSGVGSEIPAGAEHLLGFNECGVWGQCPATPCEAAAGWREMEAEYPGVKLGSPSFLGWYGYSFLWWFEEWHECYVTMYGEQPRLDFVAVHCYGGNSFCQEFLTEVIAYVDTIGDQPVWVTEFANPPMEGVTYTQTLESMAVMIRWFEDNPRITRWGWFAPTYRGDEPWIPDFWISPYSCLVDYDTGELTQCGELYRDLGGGT